MAWDKKHYAMHAKWRFGMLAHPKPLRDEYIHLNARIKREHFRRLRLLKCPYRQEPAGANSATTKYPLNPFIMYLFSNTLRLSLFVFILMLVCTDKPLAQQRWYEPADSFHRTRFWVSVASGTTAYAGLSTGLWKIWYAQYDLGPFHTFNDWPEWQQVDKAGHFFSAYHASRSVFLGLRWTGLSPRKAAWSATGAGLAILTTIEIMDGFSEKWGFSYGDMGANLLGATLFLTQELTWKEQRILLKLSSSHPPYSTAPVHSTCSTGTSSLARRAQDLYGTSPFERLLKDYNAQTNWLSFNLAALMGNASPSWLPPWLNIAVGYGAENMYGGFNNSWTEGDACFTANLPRYRQYYLSFDVDFSRLPANDKPLVRGLYHLVNFIKVPSPTLELNGLGQVKMHWLYW